MNSKLTRREILGSALIGAAALTVSSKTIGAEAEKDFVKKANFKGNIRQGVTRGTYRKYKLDDLCAKCKKIGVLGLDLVLPEEWETVKKNGMTVSMGSLPQLEGAPFRLSIDKNINRTEYHEMAIALFTKYIPMAADLNVPSLITLSGTRKGMDNETGMKNCAAALKKIMPLAEKYKINIVMELLNDKDHPDYMCDHTEWGVDLCKMVGSSRFKLLYDIYHMQRMEGEIINTIKKYHEYIGHYHTAGNPGRSDLDETQELYYPPIMKAILETGFTGFVAHEFRPKKGFESLYNAVMLCDI